MRNSTKRLDALEKAVKPTESVDFGPVLVDMLSFGMARAAAALMSQRRRDEARELVELAARERKSGLTDVQIDAAVRHMALHLESHLASWAEHPIRYWARTEENRHLEWRKDAAHVVKNRRLCGWAEGPDTDEEVQYAHTVEYWRQRDGATSEEIIEKGDTKHIQGLFAIAQRLVTLRQERGQTDAKKTDVEQVANELWALERSVSPVG